MTYDQGFVDGTVSYADLVTKLRADLRSMRGALERAEGFIKRRFPDEAGDGLTETHDLLSLIHHVLNDI